MQAFLQPLAWNDRHVRPSLTSREICDLSGLKRRTVSPCLRELASEKRVKVWLAPDNKTKVYAPRRLADCHESLVLYGARHRSQWVRLVRLGLHPMLVTFPRGRRQKLSPKEARRKAIQELRFDLRMQDRIHELWKKGGDESMRRIGVHHRFEYINGERMFLASIPGMRPYGWKEDPNKNRIDKFRRALEKEEKRMEERANVGVV